MLVDVLARLTVVVAVMLAVAIPTIVGVGRLWAALGDWRRRVGAALPIATVLVPVLLVNRLARQDLIGVSRTYGIRATGLIYDVEGDFVLLFQTVSSTPLTRYFSFIYIYAYAFMLIFPVVAYFALRDTTTLRRLLAAYTLNYAIGATVYVLVLAYGPRNLLGEEIGTMLYTFRPDYQHLTGEVNHNTNVFPSLHTSLSATVAIFAYRTRREFPLWTPVAVGLAVSVWISTMYLGIHWAVDVLAGLVLAAGSVALADRLVGRWDVPSRLEPATRRLGRTYERIAPLYDRLEALTGRLLGRT
ncbi:phosphatase PAP2 family protein [Halovivax sp.]|uniref:phosphatase PAP2 family protein n=1 Tax=Halovivax sp. TaxID=1935978 RepID=UPI0025C2230A|nr:phosphatase PAP2 family protein [Halovivax sp.]